MTHIALTSLKVFQRKYSIHFLLAAMMLHLAACSFPRSGDQQHTPKPIAQNTILTSHKTHQLLKQWHSANYQTESQKQKITFVNKHPYAPSIYKIISGYDVATFSHRTKGIGLPVIVQTKEHAFTKLTSKAYQTNIYPGSLIIAKQANGSLHITLLDPRTSPRYNANPLKTQQSIVIDHVNSLPNNHSLSLRGLLSPLQFLHMQGFYLSQPYDRKKIPIIMIHGIFSSPKAFKKMADHIEAQPDLFRKYQIWHYYYPTGTPWLATAHNFRNSYRDLIKKLDPKGSHSNLKKTTIIAHSMGGLITRISLSKPRNHLTKSYLGQQNLNTLPKLLREKLRPLFHYEPLTQPEQVIFLAVPHRGSRMASGVIGWFVEKFIAVPSLLIKGTVDVILPRQKSKLPKKTLRLLTEGENAINQLEPNNPAITALNKMKLPKRIKVHSIVGDITLPLFRVCSDGVVTYRSSHLRMTGSETIVPSDHDIIGHSKTIQRVIDILRN